MRPLKKVIGSTAHGAMVTPMIIVNGKITFSSVCRNVKPFYSRQRKGWSQAK
jgi:hypothetical protein